MNAKQNWDAMVAFWKAAYYQPDVQGLRIALAAYAAHKLINEIPVWLFLVGPSSSGKTSQIIEPMEVLPLTTPIDVLSPKSFINGFELDKNILRPVNETNDRNDGGLLFRLKGKEPMLNGFLTMSDFSMFTGLKEDDQRDLRAQMRGIFDGQLSKPFGNNKHIHWNGKVSFVVGTTEDIEDTWGIQSHVGERFLMYQMRYPETQNERLQMLQRVGQNMGKRGGIKQRQKELLYALMETTDMQKADTTINEGYNELIYLVELLSALRRRIKRDRRNGKATKMATAEMGARPIAQAIQIARGSAMIANRQYIDYEDLRLACRVILDTIPQDRWNVVRDTYGAEMQGLGVTDLGLVRKYRAKMTQNGLNELLEELHDLNVIDRLGKQNTHTGNKFWRVQLTYEYRALMDAAFSRGHLKRDLIKPEQCTELNLIP